MFDIKGKYTTANIFVDEIEEECLSQIHQMCSHRAFTNPIAIMPDTHSGKGSVIGFTMKMSDKIIPNVIGVDIGCGMLTFSVRENLLDEVSLEELDSKIRREIPSGQYIRNNRVYDMKSFPWKQANIIQSKFIKRYKDEFGIDMPYEEYDMKWFSKKCKQIGSNELRVIQSIGSLGGGNHFIELGKSKFHKTLYFTIHSGSRNFGKIVAEYWQRQASKTKVDKKNEIMQTKLLI